MTRNSIAMGMVLIGLAAGWSSAAAAEAAGMVAAVRGEARLERAGALLPARIGLTIEAGDVLITGSKARLKVLLSDDSVLALGGDSRVQISEHLFRPAERRRITRIQLVAGSLRALVAQLVGDDRADFQVRTRTAVAGVRGTEFVVSDQAGQTRLVTLSGSVTWAAGDAEPILVAAGQGSRVEQGQPLRPEALAAADLAAARQATDTTQAPTALAWNLAPAGRDRLGRTGSGPAVGADDDRDPASGSGADGALPVGGRGSNKTGGTFHGQGVGFDAANELGSFFGEWDQQADPFPPSGGEAFPVRLVVNLVDRAH